MLKLYIYMLIQKGVHGNHNFYIKLSIRREINYKYSTIICPLKRE